MILKEQQFPACNTGRLPSILESSPQQCNLAPRFIRDRDRHMGRPRGVRMLLVNRGDVVYGSFARANGWNVARRVDTWVDPYVVMGLF